MRTRFTEENCSIARALEVLGDWWTFLVIREAFLGTRRFADFQSELGIAKNVLTKRLQHLVDHDVLEKVDAGQHGTRYEYVLTPKGKDLITVVTALRQWGDRWIFGHGNEPIVVHDLRTGRTVPPLRILDDHGEPIPGRAMVPLPGPGASERTKARYAAMLENAGQS
ncbi:MAG: helix-turn-helix domain-containing protein [Polyangiaceae bacterium]